MRSVGVVRRLRTRKESARAWIRRMRRPSWNARVPIPSSTPGADSRKKKRSASVAAASVPLPGANAPCWIVPR